MTNPKATHVLDPELRHTWGVGSSGNVSLHHTWRDSGLRWQVSYSTFKKALSGAAISGTTAAKIEQCLKGHKRTHCEYPRILHPDIRQVMRFYSCGAKMHEIKENLAAFVPFAGGGDKADRADLYERWENCSEGTMYNGLMGRPIRAEQAPMLAAFREMIVFRHGGYLNNPEPLAHLPERWLWKNISCNVELHEQDPISALVLPEGRGLREMCYGHPVRAWRRFGIDRILSLKTFMGAMGDYPGWNLSGASRLVALAVAVILSDYASTLSEHCVDELNTIIGLTNRTKFFHGCARSMSYWLPDPKPVGDQDSQLAAFWSVFMKIVKNRQHEITWCRGWEKALNDERTQTR